MANAKSATRCPHTSGSAWMPCVRPTRSVPRCARPCSRSAATSRVASGHQQVGGLGQLQRQRGVQQVGRGHPVVHVGGGLARGGVVRPRGQERDHVVLGDRLHRGHRLRRGRRRGAHRVHRLGRHGPGLRVRLQHQGLHLAPQLVLVCLAPDPAHLGPRVPLDHTLYLLRAWNGVPLSSAYRRAWPGPAPAGTAQRRSAASMHRQPGQQHDQLGLDRHGGPERRRGQGEQRRRPGGATAGPVCSARRNAACPARNSATPAPRASAWAAGWGWAAWPMVSFTPAASATTPSSIGMCGVEVRGQGQAWPLPPGRRGHGPLGPLVVLVPEVDPPQRGRHGQAEHRGHDDLGGQLPAWRCPPRPPTRPAPR